MHLRDYSCGLSGIHSLAPGLSASRSICLGTFEIVRGGLASDVRAHVGVYVDEQINRDYRERESALRVAARRPSQRCISRASLSGAASPLTLCLHAKPPTSSACFASRVSIGLLHWQGRRASSTLRLSSWICCGLQLHHF